MRVLYVTGSCLLKNTSANMSHNAYVQGLIDNKVDLEIIMASDSWGDKEGKFRRYAGVKYHEYNSVSFSDRIRKMGKILIGKLFDSRESASVVENDSNNRVNNNPVETKKISFRSRAKRFFYFFSKRHPIYPLQQTWLKNARRFKDNKEYDLVISNSSPAASHRLVADLLDRRRIVCNRWIQIWEDPWYYDLYGGRGHSERILQEEHLLLRKAQEVLYVSPLTLNYQKQYFPESAAKMGVIPLPSFVFDSGEPSPCVKGDNEISFGYFGDFYSYVRNLSPFYNALRKTNMKGYIYGDSDLQFRSTQKIIVSRRVTLDVLEKVQKQTNVLVHLCNLRGGQIPGKIYHYSATDKPILFILDGTDEEKQMIRTYFEQFNRYYFCQNSEEDIVFTINTIMNEYKNRLYQPVIAFTPKEVVRRHFIII